MKYVKNIEGKPLSFDFEGFTYKFEPTEIFYKLKNEKLYDYLLKTVPLAFDFESVPGKDDPIADPKVQQTKYTVERASFGKRSKTFDEKFNSEVAGDGFYGPGLQDDTP